jgi:hypothetical protein
VSDTGHESVTLSPQRLVCREFEPPISFVPCLTPGWTCDVSVPQVELVTLTIDGVQVQVPKGTGLVEAALGAGTEPPVLCYAARIVMKFVAFVLCVRVVYD